jgi:hypothetical protein
MATPRFLRSFALTAAITFAFVLTCHGQTVEPNEVVQWDDYTFKFGPSAQMAQVLQGDKVVGSILMMNGTLQVMPLPDADGEKLKKSFDDWKAFNARSHSGGGAAAGGSAEPSCPADYAPHYLDGSAWKPMTVVVFAGREVGVSMKEGLKNPLNPNAGRTRIAMYKDPAAAITLGASPKFCIAIPASVNPEVLEIGTVDVKKDHRELEITHADKTWMPPKRLQAVDVKRISDTVVEIIPKQPLPPGQYVLGGPPTIGVYDFGVEANKTN